jgi:hypothetical protein
VVDLVALGEEVSYGGGRRLVGDGRGDDVGHVAPICLGGDVELRLAVEATESCKVDVTTENGDTHGVLFREGLEAVDEFPALLFVLASSVVVVQIVQKIDTSVELVEEATSNTKTLVQETKRPNNRRAKDVLKPLQTWVSNWDTKQQDKVTDCTIRLCNVLINVIPNLLVGLGVVDLMSRSLSSCVNAQESHALAKLAEDVSAALFDVWAWCLAENVAGIFML